MTSNQSPTKDVTILLSTLKEIAESVMNAVSAGTLEEVLQRIALVSQQLVRARYAALGVPDGEGELRYFKVVGMTEEQIDHIGHLPRGKGLLGVIMNERQILRLKDMHSHPRSVGFPFHHPEMTSLLGVPIVAGPQLFGMLYLCDREDGQPFTEQDQWLVESLAGYAALAIAGVTLSEQQGRVILLEERERVAMELHDGIIQSLYAVGMQLQLMRLSNIITSADTGLRDSIQSLDNVIEDIRSYIMNLQAVNYQQQTIYQGLSDMLARLHVPTDLSIHLDAPNRQPPFTAPVFEAICQIAHEALSNIIRHADATQANIKVSMSEHSFQMVIEDNGRGFEMDMVHDHEGLGLRNLQRRAQIHGGQVHIYTAPGQGVRLTVTLPIKPL